MRMCSAFFDLTARRAAALLERLSDVLTPDVVSVDADDAEEFAQRLHDELSAAVEAKTSDGGDLLEPGECEMCDRKVRQQ